MAISVNSRLRKYGNSPGLEAVKTPEKDLLLTGPPGTYLTLASCSVTPPVWYDLLSTISSRTKTKEIFNKRWTRHVPDFFFIWLFVSTFLVSTVLDVLFLTFLFLGECGITYGVIYTLITFAPVVFTIFLDLVDVEWGSDNRKIEIIRTSLTLLQLDYLFLGERAMKSLIKRKDDYTELPFSFRLFHMSDEILSTMKIYLFQKSVLKCLPQLFVVAIFLLSSCGWSTRDPVLPFICKAVLFHDSLIFSLAMAVLFPVRKRPRIYSCVSILLINSILKLVAGLAACALFLIVFVQTFKKIGYLAIIHRACRCLFPMWPCMTALAAEGQVRNAPIRYRALCGSLMFVAFGFLYVHPFAGRAVLPYFIIYLVNVLYDIFCLYMWSVPNDSNGAMLFSFSTVVTVFVSLFGLVNDLFKSRDYEFFLLNRKPFIR